MQRAYMRLRIIFTELLYIQLTIIFLQKFVPFSYKKSSEFQVNILYSPSLIQPED